MQQWKRIKETYVKIGIPLAKVDPGNAETKSAGHLCNLMFNELNEPPRGKTNNVVSEQFRPVQAQKRARSLKFWI